MLRTAVKRAGALHLHSFALLLCAVTLGAGPGCSRLKANGGGPAPPEESEQPVDVPGEQRPAADPEVASASDESAHDVEDGPAPALSPLENMVPEAQPGDQTARRSKKHPFARYITRIHRSIHEAWAWGFLDQLDRKAATHPLNDQDLWTRVEIVLTGDGKIDKVITVHLSGNATFDTAAREVVVAAGPFPNPPPEILSPNGKIYIHWALHRDERACGTFGAQPFILEQVP